MIFASFIQRSHRETKQDYLLNMCIKSLIYLCEKVQPQNIFLSLGKKKYLVRKRVINRITLDKDIYSVIFYYFWAITKEWSANSINFLSFSLFLFQKFNVSWKRKKSNRIHKRRVTFLVSKTGKFLNEISSLC